jgi:FtsH-binding integral membrane protein
MATALTALMVLALTFYALTTTTDFTMCGGMLFVLSFVLLGAGILNMFLKLKWMHVLITVFSIILFSMYLIYDT